MSNIIVRKQLDAHLCEPARVTTAHPATAHLIHFPILGSDRNAHYCDTIPMTTEDRIEVFIPTVSQALYSEKG